MYAKEGGTLAEPVARAWPGRTSTPNVPQPGEVLREINGRALVDLFAAACAQARRQRQADP
jgi:hypothetical protein